MNGTLQALLGAGSNSIPPDPANYLDELAIQPTAVCWLKKLVSTATVCIRVRNGTTNVETDIGFIGDALDTTALATAAGSDSLFVTTVYDQTGNGKHMAQTTASKQPMIVSAGSYLGHWLFDGTTDSMSIPSVTFGAPGVSLYTRIMQARSGSRIMFESSANYNSTSFTFIFYTDASAFSAGMNNSGANTQRRNDYSALDLSTKKLLTVLYDRALTGTNEIKSYVDGSFQTPAAGGTNENTGNFSNQTVYIGGRAGTSLYANMEQEGMVLYNTGTASIQAAIEALLA